MKKLLKILLIFILTFSISCSVFGQENGVQVEKLVKNVILDGKEVILPLYIINGNTYFKIDGALKQVGIDISFNEKTNTIEFLGHKLSVAGEKSDDKNSDNPSEENYRQPEEDEFVNCGCSCKHHSMEEYNSCPCCKGKTPLYHKEESKSESSKEEKNIETKEDEFVNCGCSCKHHSMEEYNSCPCCKGKTPQIHKEEKEKNPKNKKTYNCGCSCKHESMEEYNSCPCCKGKTPQVSCDKSAKKEFKKAKNNNSSNASMSDMDKLEPDGGMDCCCSCKCHSGQEFNECQCCKDKDLHESKNGKDTQEANNEENVEVKSSDKLTDKDLKLKDGEYIDCGCGCKHHSMKEFNECPCCCGKDVHIHRLSKSEQIFDKILDFSQYAVIVLVLLSLIWFIYKAIYDSLKKNKSKK
ncbi:hypothetical protein AAAT31_04515 [Peptoniphilus lacrimalis]|uniref:hypothetical protein n=1 Tax=Peptoniphilus lacrimalis TaxID=33031 RepID=UPI0032BF7B1C